MDGHGEWVRWRQRREERRHAAVLVATGAGMAVGNVLLLVQLTLGALRSWPLAGAAGWLVAGWIAVSALLMVAIPRQFLGLADRIAHAVLGWLVGGAMSLALWSFYWLSLPAARWAGRPGFSRRHPASVPWARPGTEWQVPTWAAKVPSCEIPGRSSGNAAVRALGVLMRQRNAFLVLMLALLLLLTSIGMIAQSAVVAPMIYTVF